MIKQVLDIALILGSLFGLVQLRRYEFDLQRRDWLRLTQIAKLATVKPLGHPVIRGKIAVLQDGIYSLDEGRHFVMGTFGGWDRTTQSWSAPRDAYLGQLATSDPEEADTIALLTTQEVESKIYVEKRFDTPDWVQPSENAKRHTISIYSATVRLIDVDCGCVTDERDFVAPDPPQKYWVNMTYIAPWEKVSGYFRQAAIEPGDHKPRKEFFPWALGLVATILSVRVLVALVKWHRRGAYMAAVAYKPPPDW